VVKATKLAASNREIIRCFMTVLLGLHVARLVVRYSAVAATRRSGRRDNRRFLRQHVSPVVDQALQPMGCDVHGGVIYRVLVSDSGSGALRLEDVVDFVLDIGKLESKVSIYATCQRRASMLATASRLAKRVRQPDTVFVSQFCLRRDMRASTIVTAIAKGAWETFQRRNQP